jgi:hypothetical protein
MNQNTDNNERGYQILELYLGGFTLSEIGLKFGLTRERVRQIIDTIFLKEIEKSISNDVAVDVGAYVELQKQTHFEATKKRKYAELIDHENELLNRVEKFSSAYAFYKAYETDSETIKEMLPKVYDKLEALESFRKNKWSKNFEKCIKCATTSVKHLANGYCENCLRDVKVFGGNREVAMQRAGQKCELCGIGRLEHQKQKDRDLTVIHLDSKQDHSVQNLSVVCYPCMLKLVQPRKMRKRLAQWSRKYAMCRKCGTTSLRHLGLGYCLSCYFKKDIKPHG